MYYLLSKYENGENKKHDIKIGTKALHKSIDEAINEGYEVCVIAKKRTRICYLVSMEGVAND